MIRCAVPMIAALALAGPACADVEFFTDQDAWSQAIGGDFTTITFADIGQIVFLDEQYAHLGIHFPEPNDFVDDSSAFLNDLWGANGFDATITVDFDVDVNWVGIHYPGDADFHLYRDGQLIGQVNLTPSGFAFGGVVSTEPFDRAVFFDPLGDVAIDDLHIPVIPGPGSAVVLVGAVLFGASRRRRGRAWAALGG